MSFWGENVRRPRKKGGKRGRKRKKEERKRKKGERK
jgi:hypothetical protein